jgi:serine/threonine-protein kinase
MAIHSAADAGREQLLDEVLITYLKGVDSGKTPDRAELLARYPDLKPELQEFFVETDKLERYAEGLSLRSDTSEVTASTPANGRLGSGSTDIPVGGQISWAIGARALGDNYELLQVIAKGGMGIIFKARDRRLNRQVALKMILSSQTLSETDRLRFHNEVDAVASLDHSHIVPIYDVGEHEGRPYFSMKLVPGGSLAGQLARYVLEPKAAARLLVPIARAVHYAHQRGVLHRDLKPSNVLLGSAEEPYVTDFGLAKRMASGDGPSGGIDLTESGAIVGTPGYMAPEQAHGKRSAVTTATDIYGLGAILYALLTGGPPFEGDDLLETLEAVRERPPQSPRELNARVDRDLELICLKCLEKEPARRYASAEILAGELECYLAGLPLMHTRSISTAEWLWRWYVRHRVLASLAAALGLSLLLLTAGSITAAIWLKAANDRERRSRQRAEGSRELASNVATRFLTRVSESEQLKAHGLERLRKDLLVGARDFWERFTREDSGGPAVQAERGKAYLRLGTIASALDADREAADAYQQAREIFKQLSADYPDVPDYRDELAGVLHQLGNMYQKTRRAAEARSTYQEALHIRQSLVNDYPSIARYQGHLGRTIFQCALQACILGQAKEAEATYKQAQRIFEQLAKEEPTNADYQEALANTFFNLGVLSLTANPRQYKTARENYENALPIYENLHRQEPQKPEYQSALARTLHQLGSVYRDTRQLDRADEAYRKASTLAERLFRDHPDVPGHRLNLATLWHARGYLYYNNDRFEDAQPLMEKAIAISQDLVRDYRDVPAYRQELGATYYDTACLYSLWTKHVGKDATLPTPVKQKLQKQLPTEAIAFLRKAQGTGHFKKKEMLETLKKDTDLEPLRSRDDYKKLFSELTSQD